MLKPRLFALTTVTAVMLAATGLGATSAHAGAGQAVVLSRGHIDAMEVTFDPVSSKPRLLVKDDTELFANGHVFRQPEDVTIDIDDEQAAFEVPEGLGTEYAFLGDPGDVVYMVPEVQNPELPWPGWSTERLRGTVPTGVTLATGQDAVELAVAVTGPGDVQTFMNGSFGEVINHYVDSSDAIPDLIPVGTNNHVHTTWIFTEQGDYTFAVTPTVKTDNGTRITGTPSTYKFHVGDPLAPITPVSAPGAGPKINGTPSIGSELYASDGDWRPAPTEFVSRQWLRDSTEIADATESNYTVTAADAGHQLTFRSTVRVGRTTATATSEPVTVLGPAPLNTKLPTIVGTLQLGQVLTATAGTWSTSGLTHTYQWLRNGKAITGATKATYRPVVADVGRNLAVKVTGQAAATAVGSATSAVRTIRPGAAPRPTSTRPKVTGKPKVGFTIKVQLGRWTPAPSGYTVQWRIGGTLLASKATKVKLKRAHKGKKVTVSVIARRAGHLDGRTVITVGKVR